MFRLDDNLLRLIWEQVEKMCVVPDENAEQGRVYEVEISSEASSSEEEESSWSEEED